LAPHVFGLLDRDKSERLTPNELTMLSGMLKEL
jgi:hypothetical protein